MSTKVRGTSVSADHDKIMTTFIAVLSFPVLLAITHSDKFVLKGSSDAHFLSGLSKLI